MSFRDIAGLDSLGRNIVLSAVLARDLVVVPLLDAVPRKRSIEFDQTTITKPIPTRSLYALDARTGRVRWTQHRPEQSRQEFEGEQDVPLAHHPDAEQGGERDQGPHYEGDRQGGAELGARPVLVY